jgi:hypothetical protein
MGGRRIFLVPLLALLASALLAPSARATFHLISIREVYPGSAASPDSGYVELQMYSSGQQFVKNHALTVYDGKGTAAGTFTFPANVGSGANQATILIGDTGVESAFGVAPDLVDAGFALAPSGGAACWAGLDCVSWGAFGGSTTPTSGSPADPPGIPDGMALRRTIAPGCPTLLEASDDGNDSSADFSDATPQPRNNASTIVEKACTGPTTTIDDKPTNPTNSASASFTYHSTPAGAEFECRLDAAAFSPCSSEGIAYPGPLSDGSHAFRVRGTDEFGTGAAALYTWTVDTAAPTVILDSHPEDPSPGASASFKYHASEVGSSFECSLAAGAAADSFSSCPSTGKTYAELGDGPHTFKVRAEDGAGNQGAPTAFEWTVENTVPDTTPPDTAIDSAPPDPSASSTASFAYHSTEAESSFECRLDGASFASCPVSGVEYTGLANGPHSFQVRAIDPSENVDPTPAGYSFEVALSVPPPGGTPTTEPAATSPPPTTAPAQKRRHRKRCRRAKRNGGKRALAQQHRKRCKRCRRPRCKRKQAGSHRQATASSFHLVSLREVYPGSGANPGAEYVELQAYAGGQNLVAGHTISLYGPGGAKVGSAEFTSDPPAGGNQVTFLAATPAAESQFGVAADVGRPAGLDPAGGAVCWEALDCVAWGGFGGALPSPAGSPADPAGIPDGMALRRTIAPGCATLLEGGDDRDDSALDFRDVFPAPRPNSAPPSESACGPGGGGGQAGGGSAGRPQTKLTRKPQRVTSRRRAVFRFVSSRPGSTFLCKLDRQGFKRCRSPFVARRLRRGRHVFKVRARAPDGAVDRTPATWRFRVR